MLVSSPSTITNVPHWFPSVVFVVAVMDITDIAHGKMDDEDKQHFIPFQQ